MKEYYHNDFLPACRPSDEVKIEDPDKQSDFGEKDLETDLWNKWNRHFNDEGRFTQVDPLWSKYPSLSPYIRVANNPFRLNDPDGRVVIRVNTPQISSQNPLVVAGMTAMASPNPVSGAIGLGLVAIGGALATHQNYLKEKGNIDSFKINKQKLKTGNKPPNLKRDDQGPPPLGPKNSENYDPTRIPQSIMDNPKIAKPFIVWELLQVLDRIINPNKPNHPGQQDNNNDSNENNSQNEKRIFPIRPIPKD